MTNLRFAIRQLLKNPGFTAVVCLSGTLACAVRAIRRRQAALTLALGVSTSGFAQDVLQPARPAEPPSTAGSALKMPPPKPAQPQPAIAALLGLFDTYQVIGLSDLHGCSELLAFMEQLVQTPEFAKKVNDLTWEPGNVRFQDLMDDFILRGQDVPLTELRRCWRENTQSHTYSDTPALFHLLQTIRRVNLNLPEARRVRVLLIDPPIDWSKIQSQQDFKEFDREGHMGEVLEREVYAKGRRALFFAGGAHLSRGGGPLQSLERSHPKSTFAIGIHEGFGERTEELETRLESWPKPALVHLRGAWLGELTLPPSGDIFLGPDGKCVEPSRLRKIQDNWDALLFLGKRKDLTRVDPPGLNVLDALWLEELKRRKSVRGGPPLDLGEPPKPQSRQFFSDDEPLGDRRIQLPFPEKPPGEGDLPKLKPGDSKALPDPR
jgi:hypothetical protein